MVHFVGFDNHLPWLSAKTRLDDEASRGTRSGAGARDRESQGDLGETAGAPAVTASKRTPPLRAPLKVALADVARALAALGQPAMIIGGVAVIARGVARADRVSSSVVRGVAR
jgi:hypothetical protein